MNEMELVTNKALREQNIDRIYILNKVKALMTIPKTDYVTSQMVANYYEVPYDTIKKAVMRHREELVEDGLRCMNAEDFLKGSRVPHKVEVFHGYKHVTFENDLELDLPNRGMMIYPRRAVLRIGMLLRDSEIAKAVRNALLDATEERIDTIEKANSNDDCLLTVINKQTEQISKQTEQINTLIGLVERLTTAYLPQMTTAVATPEPIKKETPHQVEVKPRAFIKQPKKSYDAWRDEINALVRKACSATHLNRNAVLCAAYKKLDGQYGLCLEQYRKDYVKEEHVPVTMFDVVYWMETEKNPRTAGLLAGVLTTMCNERMVG